MSYLSWLDYSSRDRRRMLDVIDQFRQRETVDELGIGGVRDTIADVLSPGTSTIQTRARYFFFIPWIYRDLERRRVSADNVAREARRAEIRLIDVLASSEDSEGTIGIEARASLKRLPSAVYWSGLRTMGIRLFDAPQEKYHRLFDAVATESRARDDNNDLRYDAAASARWNPRLPGPPKAFPEGASLRLLPGEAAFLADRLMQQAPDSLLRFLVDCGEVGEDLKFPWEHPKAHAMPGPLQRWLYHAQCFSELLYGASILYNLMLARLCKEDLVDAYAEDLRAWAALIGERRGILETWPVAEFWDLMRRKNSRLSAGAERFANSWIRLALGAADLHALGNAQEAKDLITCRERQIKPGRARLTDEAFRRLWGGASSAYQLDYRWGITQTMARDVLNGLKG